MVQAKIDVIGGSGFIGTRLVKCLKEHADRSIAILDKQLGDQFAGITQICDVRSVEQLRRSLREGAVIVNLAAEHRDDVRPVSLYHDVNVQGAINVCRVAREKATATVVFVSSVAVYGFAPPDTDEGGAIAPFNEYGKTKYQAELVFRAWQQEDPEKRSLVIIRPTVIFGEQNRGNVYNLLRQVASGRFVMVGQGLNRKSMAYVENVARFIEHMLAASPGVHVYNYIDKPDFTMNQLVSTIRGMLGQSEAVGVRLPYWLGFALGKCFDAVAAVTRRRLPISSIRVKKFCSNSVYVTSLARTGYVPKVALEEALKRTVKHEFLENHQDQRVFFTE